MIYERDKGLAAVMFPVAEVDVFAETEPGRRERIATKKAIVNTDTRDVLSVVGRRYGLLKNSDALKLARRCCVLAFPYTAPARWDVDTVEAPSSGGHCRIDLHYDGIVEGFDWAFSEGVQDRHYPFLRVTNSYNRTRVFSIHFGFTRYKCMNSVIADESVRAQFVHTADIESRIEKEINEAKFRKVASHFKKSMKVLADTTVPRDRFLQITLSILKIRQPERMPGDRREAWKRLLCVLQQRVDKYQDLGENAYALLNAVTDIATKPPTKEEVCSSAKEEVGYSFIRRERHSLQVLAGQWVADFRRCLGSPEFDLDGYVKEPSPNRLRAGRVLPRRRFDR